MALASATSGLQPSIFLDHVFKTEPLWLRFTALQHLSDLIPKAPKTFQQAITFVLLHLTTEHICTSNWSLSSTDVLCDLKDYEQKVEYITIYAIQKLGCKSYDS